MQPSTATLQWEESWPLLQKTHIWSLIQILCASLFIGLCAQIKIPLYFTPVPLTGQTFAVILIATTLSRRKAVFTTILYLMEGSLGLPVWAGGACGFHHIYGPTGGYLLSYPLQAFLISFFVEKQKTIHFLKTMAVIIASCCIQMSIGTLWLSHFVGSAHALTMGFYPFMPGEIFKGLIVTTYLKTRKKR